MKHPDFTDERVRSACEERCAEFGDPSCYTLVNDMHDLKLVNGELQPTPIKPCAECLRDCGVEPGDEFDENAAVGRLL